MKIPSTYFMSKLEEKSTMRKYLVFQEMEVSSSNMEISHIFSKKSFSYISRNGNPKKLFIFQEENALYIFFIFWEVELFYISRNGTF